MNVWAYEAVLYNPKRDEIAVFTRFYNGKVVVDFGVDFLTSETTTIAKWKQNGWLLIDIDGGLTHAT